MQNVQLIQYSSRAVVTWINTWRKFIKMGQQSRVEPGKPIKEAWSWIPEGLYWIHHIGKTGRMAQYHRSEVKAKVFHWDGRILQHEKSGCIQQWAYTHRNHGDSSSSSSSWQRCEMLTQLVIWANHYTEAVPIGNRYNKNGGVKEFR